MLLIIVRVSLVLAASFALIGVALAHADSQPTTNWQIVFSAFGVQQGNGSYVVDADGTNLRHITFAGETVREIACSPNGQYFAFVAGTTLHVLSLDGTHLLRTPVTAYTASEESAALGVSISLTNSGDALVFRSGPNSAVAFSSDAVRELEVARSNGRSYLEAVIAPDGTAIALVEFYNSDYSVVILRFPALEFERRVGVAFMPAWTADNRLLYGSRSERSLYVMDVERGMRHRLRLQNRLTTLYRPIPSPDGSLIAFLRYSFQTATQNTSRLYVMNVRTGEEQRFTDSRFAPYDLCFLADRPSGLEYGQDSES